MSATEQSQGPGTGAGDFVEQQLHELQVDVLDHGHALEILRELLHETLGADVRVEGHRGASPGESKFARCSRDPAQSSFGRSCWSGSHWWLWDRPAFPSRDRYRR